MIEGGTEAIAMAVEKSGFDLATDRNISKESLTSDEVIVVEAVVNPGSRLEGRTAGGLRINSRYGVNILAVARQGKPIRDRIGHQSNLLVMGPGGYRFGDYWRMGLPLTAITFAVAAPLLVLFWAP
jgi:di/tricarboxylate transporter